jgi:hypothetical protein
MKTILLFLTGIFWGYSNTLLEESSFDTKMLSEKNLSNISKIVIFLKSNLFFIIAFLIGQIGSILFYYSLGSELSLSTVVVISNSISILTGFIIEFLIKKKESINYKNIVKMLVSILILLLGVYLILSN